MRLSNGFAIVLVASGVGACARDSPVVPPGADAGSDAAIVALDAGQPDAAAPDAAVPDAAVDAGQRPTCDLNTDFAAPTLLPGPFHTGENLSGLDVDPNGIAMYLSMENKVGGSYYNILRVTRSAPEQDWSSMDMLFEGTPSLSFVDPALTGDGKLMYLGRVASGSFYRSIATGATPPFTQPAAVPTVEAGIRGRVRFDNRELCYSQGQDADLYCTPIDLLGRLSGVRVAQAALNSPADDGAPVFSSDGLALYFATNRTAGQQNDIWMSTRASLTAAWAVPNVVSNVNSTDSDEPAWISPNNCTMYVLSTRPVAGKSTSKRLFIAKRPGL
jgi:hypothetical protein